MKRRTFILATAALVATPAEASSPFEVTATILHPVADDDWTVTLELAGAPPVVVSVKDPGRSHSAAWAHTEAVRIAGYKPARTMRRFTSHAQARSAR